MCMLIRDKMCLWIAESFPGSSWCGECTVPSTCLPPMRGHQLVLRSSYEHRTKDSGSQMHRGHAGWCTSAPIAPLLKGVRHVCRTVGLLRPREHLVEHDRGGFRMWNAQCTASMIAIEHAMAVGLVSEVCWAVRLKHRCLPGLPSLER